MLVLLLIKAWIQVCMAFILAIIKRKKWLEVGKCLCVTLKIMGSKNEAVLKQNQKLPTKNSFLDFLRGVLLCHFHFNFIDSIDGYSIDLWIWHVGLMSWIIIIIKPFISDLSRISFPSSLFPTNIQVELISILLIVFHGQLPIWCLRHSPLSWLLKCTWWNANMWCGRVKSMDLHNKKWF